MELNMRGISTMTFLMAMAERFSQMENTMRATSVKAKQTGMAHSKISMAVNMRDSGKTTSSMVSEEKFGIMVQKPMKVNL
jgi:hypothetical protein